MTRIRIMVVLAALFAASTALAQVAAVTNPVWPYAGQITTDPITGLPLPVAPLDTPLLSSAQPKWVNQLPIPVDLTPDKTTYPNWDYYEIQMAEATPVAYWAGGPQGTEWLGLVNPLVPTQKYFTPVWGYGQMNKGGGPLGGAVTYPSMNIRATQGRPVKVKWINNAPDQHLFCPQPLNQNWPCAIDRTLMGTKADSWSTNPAVYGPVNKFGSPQQADNAMVVHLHGGEIPPNSDGFAELWFGNANSSLFYNGGLAKPIDPALTFDPLSAPPPPSSTYPFSALNLVRPIGKAMLYNYPMVNDPAMIWYHDHALGKTRINVAAGPAGFFQINGPTEPTTLPSGLPYEVNIVFQDRDFNTPQPADVLGANIARINYPNGMNWAVAAPLVPQQTPLTPGGNANVHPQWVPEYFGTFAIVNGMAWPNLNVEPRKYRFHFLDGSNARCWSLKRSDGLMMTVIGDEQGYLRAPAPTLKLLMCPGERYDVIMDFTGLAVGTKVQLVNDAPAPFPKGITPNPGDVKFPMQFTVVQLTAPDTSVIPATLPNTLVTLTPVKTRQLVLNEVLDAVTLYPLRVQIDGTSFEGAITETPTKGTVESWQIINTTGDVHPIHLHLVKYQIVSRQTFDLNGFSAATGFAIPGNSTFTKTDVTPFLKGKPRLPAAYEAGWKDTALSYPGEVLTLVAKWDGGWNMATNEDCTTDPVTLVTKCGYQGDALATDPAVTSPAYLDVRSGPYVWHCHIVDHEDNEMMRPVVVQ